MSKVFAQMLMFSGIMSTCFSASAISAPSSHYDALIRDYKGEIVYDEASFRIVVMTACVDGDPESYNFPCEEALAKVMNNPHAVVSNGLQFFNWTCVDLWKVFVGQPGLTDKNKGNVNRLLFGLKGRVGKNPGICSLQSRE